MIIETYEQPSKRNIYYDHGAVPYNFDLIMDVTSECGGRCIRDVIEKEYLNLPTGAWPTFVVSVFWPTFVVSESWPTFVVSVSWPTFVVSVSWPTFVVSVSRPTFVVSVSWLRLL